MLGAQRFDGRVVVIGVRSLIDSVEVEHVPLSRPRSQGRLDPAISRYVLEILDRAIDGCLAGRFDAMVTAPV